MTYGSRRASFQELAHAKPDLTPKQAGRSLLILKVTKNQPN